MKKFILLVFLVPVFASAQTSWAEYKFASQGFAKVADNGTGMMEGYKVVKEDPRQLSAGTVTFCRLIATDEDKAVCGIIIVKQANGATHYLGLPHPDSAREILNQALKDFEAVFPGAKAGLSEEGAALLFNLSMGIVADRK